MYSNVLHYVYIELLRNTEQQKKHDYGDIRSFFGNHGCYKWWSCRLVIHQIGKEMA